ncbi:MAG: hypothetical protein IJW37_01945 [Lachnospiraceae bacterium]|nr:hypothetical protein [Lachnospiraceae bacterium]
MDRIESDEELYALLEKAMEEEPRLQVSEELIQKTLKRVEETPAESGLKEKSYKKFYRPLRYACVAAAAVLVLAVGVKTLGNGGFSAKDSAMEAELAPGNSMRNGTDGTMEMAEYSTTAKPEDFGFDAEEIGICYSYVLGSVSELTDDCLAVEEFDAPESVSEGVMDSVKESTTSGITVFPIRVSKVEERYGEESNVILSEEFAAFLEDRGWENIDTEAVYWKLDGETVSDWETEVTKEFTQAEEEFPGAEGMPKFLLNGMLSCDTPLRYAVQLQTGNGELWLVMGEELYLLWK